MDADIEEYNAKSESSSSVGYGNPPQTTRFKKGVSGNPKGRPRGSHNVASIFAKTLRQKVAVSEHGQRKTVTKLQAAVTQLVNKAASGDLRALQLLVNLAREAETSENATPMQRSMLGEIDRKVIESIVRRFQPDPQVGGQTDE
jgi:hypothetical protein